eukprot:4000170-Pleurochrysis_carterae.AAC.1
MRQGPPFTHARARTLTSTWQRGGCARARAGDAGALDGAAGTFESKLQLWVAQGGCIDLLDRRACAQAAPNSFVQLLL